MCNEKIKLSVNIHIIDIILISRELLTTETRFSQCVELRFDSWMSYLDWLNWIRQFVKKIWARVNLNLFLS